MSEQEREAVADAAEQTFAMLNVGIDLCKWRLWFDLMLTMKLV